MQFFLTDGDVVTIKIYNPKAFCCPLSESFPKQQFDVPLPINLSRYELYYLV